MNLTQLVQEITAAVERGDRQRALELVGQIQQRLVMETAERAAVERQVRALLAELDATQHDEFRIESIDLASTERSTGGEGSDEWLYPVWFGTNRRPNADRKGFTGERHSSTTLGQVTVRVPNAHRFGETGSSFHRLATGGYVLGTCIVCCGIVAIRCQAVDSGAREASTVWRQVATFWELALSAAES